MRRVNPFLYAYFSKRFQAHITNQVIHHTRSEAIVWNMRCSLCALQNYESLSLDNVKKALFRKALYIKPFCPESLLFSAKLAYVATQRDLRSKSRYVPYHATFTFKVGRRSGT
jgi:hypothetical protein